MARTDPDVLGLCLDTGHLTYAGGDPVAAASGVMKLEQLGEALDLLRSGTAMKVVIRH